MRLMALAALFSTAVVCHGQDERLNALRATLEALHSHAAEANLETLGARPELTVAKHQLRDWIETQLAGLKDLEGVQAFSDRMNLALMPMTVGEGDAQNLLGFLGDVQFSSESGLLMITTAVGILCQYDESAYAYRHVNGLWQRIWESEQDDYSPKKYAPQLISSVHVWQSYEEGRTDSPAFIMTLGNGWGCASAWHPVYYRIWRVDAPNSRPLIDGSEEAWMRKGAFIAGSIGQNPTLKNEPVDVLLEFTERSIDTDVHNREAVRHFLIEGDRVRRSDPFALSPRDAVDEWLTRDWSESVTWSASSRLRSWHGQLHDDAVLGDFSKATTHCQTPDLWQVTVAPLDAQRNFAPKPEVHFLVRWRPPYRFTMMNVSDRPWPRCTQADPEADEWRTLFPTQEWRR